MYWRLRSLRAVNLLILLMLIGRLVQLQFFEENNFRSRAAQNTIREDYIRPIRGEIYASDGETLLASSLPIFDVTIYRDGLPEDETKQALVYSQLAELLALTDTLVLSPTQALARQPRLLAEIQRVVGPLPAVGQGPSSETDPPTTAGVITPSTSLTPTINLAQPNSPTATDALTFTIPYSMSAEALSLTRKYTKVLSYRSTIAKIIDGADLPPYLPVTIKRDVPREIALAIRENRHILPGVLVQQGFRRSYPLSDEIQSLSHLLGYLNSITDEEIEKFNPPPGSSLLPNYLMSDLIGKAGLEKQYERELRGALGVRQIEVDAKQIPVSDPLILRPRRDGNNLILTIDINLQRQSEAILKKWVEEAERRRARKFPEYPPIDTGVILAMDIKTGAILASVSLPAYNNNIFSLPRTDEDIKQIQRVLNDREQLPMLNRAISYHYPPGSTFKQVSAAAALGLDFIDPYTRAYDPGILLVRNMYDPSFPPYKFPNSIIRDRGLINVVDALKHSSNVFFFQVIGGTHYVTNLRANAPLFGSGIGAEQLARVAREWFGLGESTGIDLPGEIPGTIPDPAWKEETKKEIWVLGDTYNMSIGQGDVELTPLQLLNVTASLANGGTRYRPHVAKAIVAHDGEILQAIEPAALGRIPLEPTDLATIKEGMYRSVHDRDAHNNQIARPEQRALYDALNLAGKTGTAEYYDFKTKTWRSHSWFAGFAPYDNPRIAVVAFLEGTGDLYDGSATLALPAAAETMAVYLNINTDSAPPPAQGGRER